MTLSVSFTAEADFPGGAAEVRLCGDADITATAALDEMLAFVLSKHPDQVRLDLSAVSFLDCAGARAIGHAARALPRGRFVVCRPSLAACRVLHLTGLAGLIDRPQQTGAYPDPEEAVWCWLKNPRGRRYCGGSTTSPAC